MTNASEPNGPARPGLKRSLGLPLLTVYGVGTIVGGGFYALVGKVGTEAGTALPTAFLCSGLIALLSAFSFAELSSRHPVSAGEAEYVRVAFGRRQLSTIVGWMVVATGLVSAATLANAFAGFTRTLLGVPAHALGGHVDSLLVAGLVLTIGLVAAWGIGESATLAAIITAIELIGLAVVFAIGSPHLAELPTRWRELVPAASWRDWNGVLLGAYLAFYSFVGFEDMVNVAEEVRRPRRTLPIAILASVVVTTILYVLVTTVAVLAVPFERLEASDAPLSLVLGDGRAAVGVTLAAALAGVNGALVQIVMASRVAYGLADRAQAPAALTYIHPSTRTPMLATGLLTAMVLALALWFPLVPLAKATSTLLLLVYALVNLALVRIKRRSPARTEEGPNYPRWLPLVGFVACAAFLLLHARSLIG